MTYDLKISDNQYDQMVAVFDGVRARINPLKVPLAKMMKSNPTKVRNFIQSDNGRLLREVWKFYKDLKEFVESIDKDKE